MIRKFIQCKNTKERLNLLASSQMQDWTEGELDTVMQISGLKLSAGASMEDKWQMILLSFSNKDVTEERALVGDSKVCQDVEGVLDTEELEGVSDLAAYLKVCRESEVLH